MIDLPDSEQPDARARVLACLKAAGEAGITSSDLCDQARTHAAVRRVWELERFYGYVIIGEKLQRNQWRWFYKRDEPWARDVGMSVREARASEKLRLEAISRQPAGYQGEPPTLLQLMERAS